MAQGKTINLKTISAYFSPRAMNDLNNFLEKLPQNAGNTVLITAAIVWVFVAGLGLFTTIKAQELNNLRAKLQDAKALQPIVPTLTEVPVDQKDVADFAKSLEKTYKNLVLRPQGSGLVVTGQQTGYFNSFREAILQVQNAQTGWKIGVDKMCVGRECPQNGLSIALKIYKISIDKPSPMDASYLPSSDAATQDAATTEAKPPTANASSAGTTE